MIKDLMSSRRFAPLFWAQFCAALNDNVLKNALVIMLLYGATTGHGDALVTVAGAVFIFPFFILSGLGGELADKFVKSVVARRIKFAEIFAAGFAALGFFTHSIPLLFVALGLFGICAALFGPVKYAMLPDQLSVGELATGNALVEGATFLAILIGTIAGGLLVSSSTHMGWVTSAIMLLALASWGFASRIPHTTPSAADLAVTANPWTSTIRLLKSLHAEPRLWDGMVIVSWFWLAGAVVLSLLPALIKGIVGGTEAVVTLCLAIFAIGIAVGSLFAAQLSHVRPNLALVPIGAIIMGIVWPRYRLGDRSRHHRIGHYARGIRDFVQRPAHDRRLRDFRLRWRPVRRAVLCRRAGMVGAFRAGARDRRRQYPASRLHGGRLAVRCACLQAAGPSDCLDLCRPCAGLFGSVWFVLGKWGKEGVRDFGALLFRAMFRVEVRGIENLRRRRHADADRPQPCQPDRWAAGACDAADRGELRGRYRHRESMVGQAVPAT